MNILSVDTATEAFSVALQTGDEVQHHLEIAPQQHSRLLLNRVDQMLAEVGIKPQDLDGLVVGRGPGSFTGVRIAISAVQGMALGLNCPVVGISTLAAIAHRAWREYALAEVVATIDARMQQLYWARYQTKGEGHCVLLGEEQVTDAAAVIGHGSVAVGTGAAQYRDALTTSDIAVHQSSEPLLPTAWDMLMLSRERFATGDVHAADQLSPVYLRDKVAQTEAERKAERGDG